jgi:aryl-alcohol dehydrogenase-like predicted oxidoreductase
LAPLEQLRASGKVRAVGYSGDGAALAWAAKCETFDVVECSVNLVDQEALELASTIHERGLGVLAKRSLAGAPWEDPSSTYRERWQRWSTSPFEGLPWDEVALRFAAYAPVVSAALFGTRRVARVVSAVEAVRRGPLPDDVVREITSRFTAHAELDRAAWAGVI